MDPILDGLHLESDVGNGVGDHDSVFAFGNIVILSAVRGIGDLEAFSLDSEVHHGDQADLGIGIGHHHGGRRHAERGHDDLVGTHLHGELLGAVARDVHHGALGLRGHGVGNLDGLERAEGVFGGLDVQLEGLGERDAHRGTVGEGQDDRVVGDGEVREDAVLEGGAFALDRSEVGLLAIDLHPQVAVIVDGEDGRLIHGDFLSVHLDGHAVHGPDELARAVADHGEHGAGGGIRRDDVEVHDVAVGVGDGDTGGAARIRVLVFFHLADELAVADGGLQGRDVGLQLADPGVQAVDQFSQAGVVIFLGAAHSQERQRYESDNLFHMVLYLLLVSSYSTTQRTEPRRAFGAEPNVQALSERRSAPGPLASSEAWEVQYRVRTPTLARPSTL